MNVYERMARAMEIFNSYQHPLRGISAGHDEMRAGPPPSTVSPQDLAELQELGWLPDDHVDCFHCFT